MNFIDICKGLHLLARSVLAIATSFILGWVAIKVPDVSIELLATISAPSLAYIAVKWTGNSEVKE